MEGFTRIRRLRRTPNLRALVRESHIQPEQLVYPLFITPGYKKRSPISSLPGIFHMTTDEASAEVEELQILGVNSFLLFGIPEKKDEDGSYASREDGVVQNAIREIKKNNPSAVVITDLCFCEYTSHGHCGHLVNGDVDNDSTLMMIVQQTLSHAQAGADMIAPSGMIDGAVKAMRTALDQASYQNIAIMAYAAKFASSFYGPFRDAVSSTPSHGDRKSYQMDTANPREALREVQADLSEGADILMIKPALPYLDVIYQTKNSFLLPIAAYQVSGEYSMIKCAAQKGLIDEKRMFYETLTSIKRAGADIIITYYAKQAAQLIKAGDFIA
jgi:porphobilinogen synthase